MAHLKDILEIEQQRTTDTENRQVHLFQEGTFYRAYERSAWLVITYISPLKPTRRNVKGQDESIVFCGFPLTSLSKYTPDGCAAIVQEDKSVTFSLPETLYPQIVSAGAEQERFNNWKQSVPLSESKKDAHKESIIDAARAPMRLTEIMQQILAFPIEQKTPMEAMLFLSEIKQNLSHIL